MNKRYEYGGFIYCDDDLSKEIKKLWWYFIRLVLRVRA